MLLANVFLSLSESLILRNKTHTGPVRGLDFNPIQTNLFASGAVNGEVCSVLCSLYITEYALDLHLGPQRS